MIIIIFLWRLSTFPVLILPDFSISLSYLILVVFMQLSVGDNARAQIKNLFPHIAPQEAMDE